MPGPVICWPTKSGTVAEPMTVAAVLPLVVCMTSDWAVGAVEGVVIVTAETAPVAGAERVNVVGPVMEAMVAPAGTLVPVTEAPIMRLLVPAVRVTTLLPLEALAATALAITVDAAIGLKSKVEVAVGAVVGAAERVTTPVAEL